MVCDKGALIINFNKQGKNKNNVYIRSSITEREIALKAQELAMKDREIENLREIIALLKIELHHYKVM